MRFLLLLLLLHHGVRAVLEYETEEGWKVALRGNQLELRQLKSLLVHTSDRSMRGEEEGRRVPVPALQCEDSVMGLSAWILQLPRCSQLFHDQNCVHCVNRHSSCCSVDLVCSSCMQQAHLEIHSPKLLCDAVAGGSLRTVDPSTCVLQIQLSQNRIITHTEILLAAWLFFYNLGLFLAINAVYSSWIIKTREFTITCCLSLSVLLMFEVYLYLQSWYVLVPFSAVYVILCLLPLYRLFMYRLAAKTKKEQEV